MTAPFLVAGASGFVGRQLVTQLAARGRRTIAHVRPDSAQLARWQAHFATLGAEVDTTPWQAAAWTKRLLELRPAVVLICIGTTQKRARADQLSGNPYELVDYGLTKLVVDAAQQASREQPGYQPRLVYLSSMGADPKARSAYLSWRGKAEAVVRDSGLPWMIARPSIITEVRAGSGATAAIRDDQRPGERAAAVVGDAVLAMLGFFGAKQLRARYRSTTPDILAAALIRLADDAHPGRVAIGAELR
jgi:uncharacterized protein YbjT (DUF2867 family)